MNDLVSERMRSLSRFSTNRNTLVKMDSMIRKVRSQRFVAPRSEEVEIHRLALEEVLGNRYRAQFPVPMTHDDSLKIPDIEARIRKDRAAAGHRDVTDTTKYIDSVQYENVDAHFKLGRAYETFEEIHSAREEYQHALAIRFMLPDTSKEALHAQVLYAWMQLEKKQRRPQIADSLLQELILHYGQTVFAEQARKLYGIRDASARGESAYLAAYEALRQRGPDGAKPAIFDVVQGFSHEDVAPRALYALGLTYEEQQHFDSALVYYKRVLLEYPYSAYADALRPRIPEIALGNPQSPASNAPLQKRSDPADFRTDDEKQKQEAERARKMREEQQRKQLEQSQPGLPPIDQPEDQPVNVDPPQPSIPPPSSPFEMGGKR
jgi:tetratricopeptide (TPR) repeat protein